MLVIFYHSGSLTYGSLKQINKARYYRGAFEYEHIRRISQLLSYIVDPVNCQEKLWARVLECQGTSEGAYSKERTNCGENFIYLVNRLVSNVTIVL